MEKSTEVMTKSKETQLVIFRLREEEFGIEINSVLEISRMLEITYLPQTTSFIEGVVNLRGQVIPVVDLGKRFGFKTQAPVTKAARIIVVEISRETLGLLVDEVPEVIRISETEIKPPPDVIQNNEKQDYIKGVAKLGERLVVVLDLAKVLSPEECVVTQKAVNGSPVKGGKGES